MKRFRCPRCKRVVYEFPATSRIDKKTEICSKCGEEQAVIMTAPWVLSEEELSELFRKLQSGKHEGI
ncbi:MAG: hypothetical protein ACXACY_20360 [Candidatus Hodarchaeales archaeon]